MYTSKLTLLAIVLFSSVLLSQGHEGTKCIHDQENHEPQFLDVEEEPLQPEEGGRMLASYPYIRIYSHYDTLTYGTTTFKNYVKYDLLPPALAYFSKALKVKQPLRQTLKVGTSIKTLCSVRTPTILQTTGVNTDHFFFVTAESASDSWAAGSSYCFLATDSKRPLISRIKFNAKWLKIGTSDVLAHESNTYLLMHELFHSFGFSRSLFQYFLDENGRTRKNIINYVRLNGSTRSVLNIPTLTTKLRSHYGCTSLEGAYLENNGGDGTEGSHFERRHFLYEVMTSGVMPGRRISEFSLGVLEGSGWYQIDYNYAEPFHFGTGQGCNFLKESCTLRAFNFEEFCKVSASRGCTPQGEGGGVCQSDTRSDSCKHYYPTEVLDCQSPDAHKYARLPELQTFGRGSGSKCFNGNLVAKGTGSATTFCFKYSCSGSGLNTILSVQVGKSTVVCRKEGSVSVKGYSGSIHCPDPLSFCNGAGKQFCPRQCMGRGSCVNNKCVCLKGYKGIDCGLRV